MLIRFLLWQAAGEEADLDEARRLPRKGRKHTVVYNASTWAAQHIFMMMSAWSVLPPFLIWR